MDECAAEIEEPDKIAHLLYTLDPDQAFWRYVYGHKIDFEADFGESEYREILKHSLQELEELVERFDSNGKSANAELIELAEKNCSNNFQTINFALLLLVLSSKL